MARRYVQPQALEPAPLDLSILPGDPPPDYPLPPRQAPKPMPVEAAAPAPTKTASAPEDPMPAKPQPEKAVAAIAPPPPSLTPDWFHLDDLTIAIALGAALLLTAFAALFAWLAWRRGALSNEMVRASAEFTRSSVSILANEVQHTERSIRDETALMRDEADARGRNLRGEIREQIHTAAAGQTEAAERLRGEIRAAVAGFGESLKAELTALGGDRTNMPSALEETLREAFARVEHRLAAQAEAQDKRLGELRAAMDARLEDIRIGTEARLNEMRLTVKRLGERRPPPA